MSNQIDFHRITPCGECCVGCGKRTRGLCHGCLETGGHCEEWAASGMCPAFACCRKHQVPFCGMCPEFPCDHLPMKTWRPDCIRELTELAEEYRAWLARPVLYCLTLSYYANKRRQDFHIGLFRTREEAEAVSQRYRRELPGFCRPDVFDEIYKVPLVDATEIPCCVYRWVGYDLDDELEENDIIESGCYASESAAKAAFLQAQRDISRQEWALNRHVIGQCDWPKGFDTST